MTGLAIWMYGSVARGDADPQSDLDVLVLGNAEPNDLARHLPVQRRYRLSVSRYSWDELRMMAEYGSLFLQHLRLEGVALYEDGHCEGRLRSVLQALPSYAHVERDVRAFQKSAVDIRRHIADTRLRRFELASMAALLRRVAILVCCLRGEPRFDRLGAFERLVGIWGLPQCYGEEFASLYRYRLLAEGSTSSRLENPSWLAQTWVPRMDEIVERLLLEQYDGES